MDAFFKANGIFSSTSQYGTFLPSNSGSDVMYVFNLIWDLNSPLVLSPVNIKSLSESWSKSAISRSPCLNPPPEK